MNTLHVRPSSWAHFLLLRFFPLFLLASSSTLAANIQWGGNIGLLFGFAGQQTKLIKTLDGPQRRDLSAYIGRTDPASGFTAEAHVLMNNFMIGIGADILMQFGDKKQIYLFEGVEEWESKSGKNTFGTHLTLGYQCQKVTPYIKAGMRFKKMQLTITDMQTGSNLTLFDQSKWRTGFFAGLGMCWSLSSSIDFGMETALDFYSENTQSQSVILPGAGASTVKVISTPQDFRGLFYLRYRF